MDLIYFAWSDNPENLNLYVLVDKDAIGIIRLEIIEAKDLKKTDSFFTCGNVSI